MSGYCGQCGALIIEDEEHKCRPAARCPETLSIIGRSVNQITGKLEEEVRTVIARCSLAAGHVGAHHMSRYDEDAEAPKAPNA